MSGHDWVNDPDLDLRAALRRLADLVPMPVRPVPPSEPEAPRDSVLSLRVNSGEKAALMDRARELGVSASDLLRDSARVLTEPVGWTCQHVSIFTGGTATLANVEGCRCGGFRPVYR